MSGDLRLQFSEWGIETAEPRDRYYREGWVNTCCPRCQGPKKSLGFSELFWNATCWRCGKQNAWDAIQQLKPSLTKSDIAKAYGNRSQSNAMATANFRTSKTGTLRLPETTPLLPSHREYLKRRGFNVDMLVDTYGVCSTSRHSLCGEKRLGDRIFAPIHDPFGAVVSWTTRAVDPRDPVRWFTAPRDWERMQSGSLLYGFEHVRHTIIVVEGPSDVWNIGPAAAATMGMVLSNAQINAIATVPRRVILFDSSLQAQRRANALAAELGHYPGETFVATLEHASDPGDVRAVDEINTIVETFLQ